MRATVAALAVMLAGGCGPARGRAGSAPAVVPPVAMVAALPPPAPIDTPRFASVVVCVRCHTAGERAMRDARGRDVSPIGELGPTMMALSARDPYYLAALRRELDAHPAGRATIIALCVRCHAPVGFAEAAATQSELGLPELTAETTPVAILARDGVGCAGCHALAPAGLGSEASFVGQAPLAVDRVSYGAQAEPIADAMVKMSNTRPTPSAHISQSALCASCHTVLVRSLDDHGAPMGAEVAEQATYLEWRDSQYQDETPPTAGAPASAHPATCQSCHMRATDDDGAVIATAFSTRPPAAPVRASYRRHDIHGGNAYLLGRLAAHAGWLFGPDPRPTITGAPTAAALQASAIATEAFLGTAARLDIQPGKDGVRVTIANLTGHKLPTGFPTRRMWLHVIARDAAGAIVLESGAQRDGTIVGAHGDRLDSPGVILPHRAWIGSPNDVAIWEAVAVDAAGAPTHVLLGTARFAKDDRLLPAGWRADHPDGARTKPIGADGDADFRPGQAVITVVLPDTVTSVDAELDYQAIPPETLASYRPTDSPEAARFLAVADVAPAPTVIARAHWSR